VAATAAVAEWAWLVYHRCLAGSRASGSASWSEYAQPLDVEALARGAHLSAGHLSRQFRRAYGESPYGYLMTRRIERAMALLRRGDRSVTEVCFAVGCGSLGSFSSRLTELVGVPPSVYRRLAARATAGMPSCVAKQVTRPVRNREAPPLEPQLA
jgi:AraC-like DNA-binding protein